MRRRKIEDQEALDQLNQLEASAAAARVHEAKAKGEQPGQPRTSDRPGRRKRKQPPLDQELWDEAVEEATSITRLTRERLKRKANYQPFVIWLVGTSRLICHAWSEKARQELLGKQIGTMRAARERRNPEKDFENSLYLMGEKNGKKIYGFPATAFKLAMHDAAGKEKGIAKTKTLPAIYIRGKPTPLNTAVKGAICDMDLVRIYGDKPIIREDHVRVGAGLSGRTSTLSYRAQFNNWAVRLTGRVNRDIIPLDNLLQLFDYAGTEVGIGDWRVQKKGQSGMFRCATTEEGLAWEAYAKGEGPMPKQAMFDEEEEEEFDDSHAGEFDEDEDEEEEEDNK